MSKLCVVCGRKYDLSKDTVFINPENESVSCITCMTPLIEDPFVEKMYFKMYQDIKEVDGLFCTVTKEQMIEQSTISNKSDCCDLMPVFEPVFMTEKAFSELPEFEGY